jgi:hypothetical protein
MKIIKNEFDHHPIYEVDDLDDFDKNITLDDFIEIEHKLICLVDELYNLFIIEFNNRDKLYKYKKNKDFFLIVAKNKYYICNWNGKFMNVLETSADEYEMGMLNKIRNNEVIYFTTQF